MCRLEFRVVYLLKVRVRREVFFFFFVVSYFFSSGSISLVSQVLAAKDRIHVVFLLAGPPSCSPSIVYLLGLLSMLPRAPYAPLEPSAWVSRVCSLGETCQNVPNQYLEHSVRLKKASIHFCCCVLVCVVSVTQTDLANTERWVVARNEDEAKAKAATILGCEVDKVNQAEG